ncbi:Hg(II)-responsive transcriptional regulator [Oxalobacteraceae bacterium R-40]|uniref:Mercuric resistance operon regulatory protein n=1 Tax=Keguizhuia sedimenti TaxID=3064264 RepID=A0ABU1BJR4_9BURK|nr:Hg(II)-responsive transcriptional regulator [Oxalobacteraceae bacterium R-40]
MANSLTIGKVAKAAGVNVETIRFYQRRGLLDEPRKQDGGFRYYDERVIERVRFIKRAQVLGFTLEEISGLMTLDQYNCCKQTHDAAVAKLDIVESRIKDLNRMRKTLKQLINQCELGSANVACPIIESLGKA